MNFHMALLFPAELWGGGAPYVLLQFLYFNFSHPFFSPLRSWQQTFRFHQPLLDGNLLPFGLNSITLHVPYSIHKQEVKALILWEDVVKVFVFH